MKHLAYILLAIFLLTACRTESRLERQLTDIDSLTAVDADSARRMLTGMEGQMADAPEQLQAYYQLLVTKAADRMMRPHTSDSMMCAVVRYYEEHPEDGHLTEAYYYMGRTQSDMLQGEKALLYFVKALLRDSTQLTPFLKSRIYAQMGYIYLRNRLLDEAADMQQMAHFYCRQIGDTLGMRYTSEDMKTISELSQRMHVDSTAQQFVRMRFQKVFIQARNQVLTAEQEQLQVQAVQRRQQMTGMVVGAGVGIGMVMLGVWLGRRRNRRKSAPADAAQPTMPAPNRRQFYDAEVGQMLAERLRQNKALKPADWQLIEARLKEAFPTFRDDLFALYELSDTEYHICMLTKLEVSPSNMAKLMATGVSTISQSRLRMQQKVFGGQGSAKDWDTYVLSL